MELPDEQMVFQFRGNVKKTKPTRLHLEIPSVEGVRQYFIVSRVCKRILTEAIEAPLSHKKTLLLNTSSVVPPLIL